MTEADLQVTDNGDERRFEGHLEGELVGVIEYRPVDGGVIAEHTEVGDEYEGQGLASQLVGGMIDILRQDGRSLEVECSYVRSWLDRHPEATDVVESAA